LFLFKQKARKGLEEVTANKATFIGRDEGAKQSVFYPTFALTCKKQKAKISNASANSL
jgi:hypothetical protein